MISRIPDFDCPNECPNCEQSIGLNKTCDDCEMARCAECNSKDCEYSKHWEEYFCDSCREARCLQADESDPLEAEVA